MSLYGLRELSEEGMMTIDESDELRDELRGNEILNNYSSISNEEVSVE